MTTAKPDPIETITQQRVLPVLRSESSEAAVARTTVLVTAGAYAVELTTSTPDWADALRHATAEIPNCVIGLGTVTTGEQATAAIEAGARFLVSPYGAPAVRATAAEAGVPFLEGGLTPSELAASLPAGIAKVFPAHVGGPSYIRSLQPVLPGLKLIPTGGIALADVKAYLAAGAVAVGVGSGLPEEPRALADTLAKLRGDEGATRVTTTV